jgi:hypothetical protein
MTGIGAALGPMEIPFDGLTVLGCLAALVGTAGLGGILKTWLDHKRGKRAQTDSIALALVGKQGARIDALERELKTERERCEDRLQKIEAEQHAERRRSDVELRHLRHRANNMRQIIYALLHLFDVPTRQRKGMLAGIREELLAIETAETIEKGSLLAAEVRGPTIEGSD